MSQTTIQYEAEEEISCFCQLFPQAQRIPKITSHLILTDASLSFDPLPLFEKAKRNRKVSLTKRLSQINKNSNS